MKRFFELMTERAIFLYRKMNNTGKRTAIFVLAVIIAFSTMHILTFPATAMTRSAGVDDPAITVGTETEEETPEEVTDDGTETVAPLTEGTEPEVLPANEPAGDSEGEPVPPASEGTEEPVNTDPADEETDPAVTPDEETVTTPEPSVIPVTEPEEEPEEEDSEESDSTADVETAADWENMFREIELTGEWADDLVTLAETQIGYTESEKNFIVDEEGNKHGYTRYGDWHKEPYAEWDSLFILFNLSYAGITPMDFPFEADCETWIAVLTEAELFRAADSYTPARGDLVFADTDEDGRADHAAIVTGIAHDDAENQDQLTVIEGDVDNAVKENTYELHNLLILGYAVLPENPQLHSEPEMLTFTGTANRVEVTVLYEKGAFPDGTEMHLETIWKKDVIDAISETVKEENKEVVRVQAVDITFIAPDGTEIYPSRPIQVTMKSLAVPEEATDKPSVVHVDNDMNTSVVDAAVPAEEPMGSKEAVTFEADTFSVYAIVYTVDFSYEVNGRVYGFTMQGADTVSLRALIEALHVYEKESEEINIANEDLPEEVTASEDSPLDKFMAEIENVTFSDTSLLVPAYVEEDATAGEIKSELKVFPTYPLGLSQEEVLELNAKEYKEGDWILISMKPFDTTETLTVSMKNGNEFYITVTDAQDAPMDGDKVQTISNPAGTTIDLFDYWVIRQDIIGRDAWGDLNQGWGGHDDSEGLNGSGNNKGINSSTGDAVHGHALKFSPAWEGTVFNGTKNNWTSLNTNGRDGLNSYTGNGDPFQGIVQGSLADGYPVLTNNGTIGSNGESLAYLFDPSMSHDGKASYPSVNQLLYVDSDGYYTYDSRDYAAAFDTDSKTFTVTEQTSDDGEIRGFWPFGTQNFWSGLHINTQFSMPSNGQVLNPAGEYKDMQFEFSGDDDTWLYVDGVLVGDGGGIHNRTEIDINFASGKVTVTGEKADGHSGHFEVTQYLDDIFKSAGKYNDADWEPIPGDEEHKRFKAGTYHTFDMFYLERGGGESNLYIHYNLVSTADFTAHKSYRGRDSQDLLQRNQFKFELIGLDGKYRSVWDAEAEAYVLVPEDTTTNAIMPSGGSITGKGTVESPYYNNNTVTELSDGTTFGSQSYITGVTEDGNVNFGSAVISEQDMHDCDEGNPPVYRYIVREVVPDDAVNNAGVAWKDATAEQREAGGFVYNSITYDGAVYYMTARVTKWNETGPDGTVYVRHGLAKTYYTNDTYTTVKPDTQFISFENTYIPGTGDLEFTKVKTDGTVLPGAVFGLFSDSACKKPAKDSFGQNITATSDSNGIVKFEDIPTGMYFMKEIEAPQGYELNPSIYKAYVIDKKGSSYVVDWDNNPVETIVNVKPSELSVIKKWQNSKGEEITETKDIEITLKRYHEEEKAPEGEAHTVSLQLHIDDPDWGDDYRNIVVEKSLSSKGDYAEIEWYDCWQNYNSLQVLGGDGNPIGDDEYLLYPIDQNDHTRMLVIPHLASDIQIKVNYPSGAAWLWQDNDPTYHKTKFINPSISIPVPTERKEDPDFSRKVTLTAPGYTRSWDIGGSDEDYEASGFDLPKRDSNGREYAYFVVEETLPEGYEVTYENNEGILKGIITVINKDTRTVTADIRVVKVIRGTETPLQGAAFTLTQVDENGNVITGGIQYKDIPVGENGVAEFKELVPGRYKLEETVVPTDYIKEEGFYYLVVSEEGNAYVESGHSYKLIHERENNEFLVDNDYGVELPKTGGPGTGLFYVLGGILVFFSGMRLVKRHKNI